jgi:hypothetical protein
LIKVVDFKAWLRGPVFEPLKSPAYFRRFFLDGGTVAWPNGADIAPEALYQEPGEVEERPAAEREDAGADEGGGYPEWASLTDEVYRALQLTRFLRPEQGPLVRRVWWVAQDSMGSDS